MPVKVLVIEDDLDLQENIVGILEYSGFQVVIANDGIEGIYAAQFKKPHIILCDITLPAMEGFDVIRKLQESQETASIPFIFLTARSERDDLRQGMELGADDYITKPFTSVELVNAIEIRLKKNKFNTELFQEERRKNIELSQQIKDQENYIEVHQSLTQGLAEELRNPISNISMAIHMLKMATTPEEKNKYINILQTECSKELNILNKISSIRELLSAENISLLSHFKLLK